MLTMKIRIRIVKPQRWKEDFLTDVLIKEGFPREYFSTNIEEDVEILVSNCLSVEELNTFPKLKHIIIPTSGIEGVCIRSIKEKKINIHHDYSITSRAVAGYVSNKLEFVLEEQFAYFMKGSTIGFLGFGNVGREIYKALKHFDCNFEAFTNENPPPFPLEWRSGKDGLSTLLSQSDILINTLPLTPETNQLLYGKTEQMKKRGIVVSVSRSGILDDLAVLEAVYGRNLHGAILDVYSEKIDANDYRHKRVVLTPHIAGIYGEALSHMASFIRNAIQDALRG